MARLSYNIQGWLLLLLIAGLVLSGCGANTASPANQQGDGSNSSTEAQPTNAETRVVQDEYGEVTIPVHPQRIAGIYVEDYLKALDITPIVQWYHPMWGVQDYLNLDVPQFDITGSVEALLEYNPDLIIVDGGVDAAQYELYKKVAPTYRIPEKVLEDSNQVLATVADVVGQPEKGKAFSEQFKQKIADAKNALHTSIGNETVAVVRLNVADKGLALFGAKNRYTGFIYSDLGLTPHPLARDMQESQEILSEEAIPSLDADHIIVFPSTGTWDSKENQEAVHILDGKLWQSLPAVKNKQVYFMERSHWQSGAVIANSMKIDDLLSKMTP